MALSFKDPRARQGWKRLDRSHLAPVSPSLNLQHWDDSISSITSTSRRHIDMPGALLPPEVRYAGQLILNCQYVLSACRADRHNG